MNNLLKKIEDRSARVVVVGIGYVGLPLVVEFAAALPHHGCEEGPVAHFPGSPACPARTSTVPVRKLAA